MGGSGGVGMARGDGFREGLVGEDSRRFNLFQGLCSEFVIFQTV